MINDFAKMYIWISKPNEYIKQAMFHHIAIFIAFFCSMVGGYAYPGICNLFLIAEVSSIFLNYNDMFTKENRNSRLALCNKITFFVFFTVTRVIAWPYYEYLIVINLVMIWESVGIVRSLCVIIGWIQSILVLLLNFYWYYKIVKKLIRIIKGVDGQEVEDGGDDEYKKSEDEKGEGKEFDLERT